MLNTKQQITPIIPRNTRPPQARRRPGRTPLLSCCHLLDKNISTPKNLSTHGKYFLLLSEIFMAASWHLAVLLYLYCYTARLTASSFSGDLTDSTGLVLTNLITEWNGGKLINYSQFSCIISSSSADPLPGIYQSAGSLLSLITVPRSVAVGERSFVIIMYI